MSSRHAMPVYISWLSGCRGTQLAVLRSRISAPLISQHRAMLIRNTGGSRTRIFARFQRLVLAAAMQQLVHDRP